MQCPPVEGFAPLNRSAESKKVEFDALKNNIEFCHSVSFAIPNVQEVPDFLREIFSEDPYFYQVFDIPLDVLLKSSFIDNFVKKGELSVLCANHIAECSNFFAIYDKCLHLSLLKETVQSLNLRKHPELIKGIQYPKTGIANYKFKISLEKLNKYEDTRTELAKLGTFNVIAHWQPPIDNKQVCASSLARYFAFHKLKVVSRTTKEITKLHACIKVPVIDEREDETGSYQKCIEWLGAISLNCCMESDDYLSSYDTPEPYKEIGKLLYVQYDGFITNSHLLKIIEGIRSQTNPCLSTYFHTFPDDIIIRKNRNNRNYLMLSVNDKQIWLLLNH